jgi:HD-like signal output (HDOD) protein
VNSAFFGLTREVVDVDRAVALLGVETINALLLSRAAFDSFERVAPAALDSLWRHSLLVGQAARLIVECEDGSQTMRHVAYEAGLMHDIGKLVLATVVPGEAKQAGTLAAREQKSGREAELQAFGCDHGVIGAYLLDLWGLPASIVEAVAYHHRPAASSTTSFGAVVAVHVGNALLGATQASVQDSAVLDADWLASIGLDGRVPAWRERLAALRHEIVP